VNVESFVIFTTAYDEYAIRAFELNSIDYLLKPIDKEKLAASVEKFKKLKPRLGSFDIESLVETLNGRKKSYKKRFLVNIGQKIKSVDINDVSFFYSSEKSTFLCSIEDRHYAIDFSLDTLEKILDPDMFFRINRKFIAGRAALDKIIILSKSRIKIELNPSVKESVYVSNARAHEFRLWLDE
jgi:DNA-binding LytR/AlgR family response regulator